MGGCLTTVREMTYPVLRSNNMKNVLAAVTLLITLIGITSYSFAQTGYRRDPWGGNTWTGPGAPPHWSPEGQLRFNKLQYKYKVKHHKRLPYWHSDAASGHPNHHPPYHSGVPYHKPHLWGSHVYIYAGPGGWFISAGGNWRWHDHRRRGYVYYSQPIYHSQFIIVESDGSSADDAATKRRTPDREGFTPLRTKNQPCAKGPSITYGANGTVYMTTEKPLEGCR